MTLPVDPLSLPDAYTGEGGKLKEPGAGWRNDLIESAATKAAMEPDNAGDKQTDFMAGTDPEENRRWLHSLRCPVPLVPGPCAWCSATTTRAVVFEAYQVKGRNWGLRGVYQCDACMEKEAIAKLERIAANPEVLPRLREAAVQELATMRAEVAA